MAHELSLPAEPAECPECGRESLNGKCLACRLAWACSDCRAPLTPRGSSGLYCAPCGAKTSPCSGCGRTIPYSALDCPHCRCPADCSRCGSKLVRGDCWRGLCISCVDAVHGAEEPCCPGCGHPSPDGECACPRCLDCGMVLILGDGAYGRCGDCASELLRPRPQR